MVVKEALMKLRYFPHRTTRNKARHNIEEAKNEA